MRFLYSTSIRVYIFFIRIASLWNQKAHEWIKGRKDVFNQLEIVTNNSKPVFWVHCASVGEFEQARPLLEKIDESKTHFVLLTFFSPSGYELRKNYDKADFVCYLPADLIGNSKKFLEVVKPQIAVFVKYEFWFNHLNELKKNQVKTYLISGIFRPKQHFFKFYGFWFKKHLEAFNHFFIQNKESLQLLNSIGFQNASISGDTRFDRVHKISKEQYHNEILEHFCKKEKTVIAGSTWDEEHNLIAKYFTNENDTCNFIIAPHQINTNKIAGLQKQYGDSSILFSKCSSVKDLEDKRIIIVDSIGLLSKLYKFADIALIGGGFGAGIHNTLEAATFGKPILFGPNYKKFQEAKDLIKCNAAVCINNYSDFQSNLNKLLSNNSMRESYGKRSQEYVESNLGATNNIFEHIFGNL